MANTIGGIFWNCRTAFLRIKTRTAEWYSAARVASSTGQTRCEAANDGERKRSLFSHHDHKTPTGVSCADAHKQTGDGTNIAAYSLPSWLPPYVDPRRYARLSSPLAGFQATVPKGRPCSGQGLPGAPFVLLFCHHNQVVTRSTKKPASRFTDCRLACSGST